ncbi:MAG: heavy metal translocating P-type ATPase, partial [Gemmatimonadota bacterium]
MSPRVRAALAPSTAFAFLAAGFILYTGGLTAWAERTWFAGLLLTGVPIIWKTTRGLLARRFAADVVASLAILASIILLSPVPGLIVALMQTGGEALERYAEGRASLAVRELEATAPRTAHRVADGVTTDIPVDQVAVGDVLLVRPGELIPCDAVVIEGRSSIDASRLTGEPVPVDASAGTSLMSGSVNGASPLTIRARNLASQSQYARIVELVRTAQASKSPFQRMADRYAIWFTPATILVCAVTLALSRDWNRVLAVLVVATPCPLILATPIAIIGGINQAARRMVIFRTGNALEQLGAVTAVVLDKTGTITIGRPRVSRVVALDGFEESEVLRLASGVEEGSSHLMARTLVEETVSRGIVPPATLQVEEAPGQGVWGRIGNHEVAVGGRSFIVGRYPGTRESFASHDGDGLQAYVAIDGKAAAIIEYADALRPGVAGFIARLRGLGVHRVLLLSGDSSDNVAAMAASAGITEARGSLLPEDKSRLVRDLMDAGETVVMMGDGTNDAPALSTAHVGVALAAGGGGISAEAADVVLLADNPASLLDALTISRRTLRIARQSLRMGMALSGIAVV